MSVKGSFRARHRISPEDRLLGKLIDPIDRLSETIFSILILLTFTLAFRIVRLSGEPDPTTSAANTNELLIGALGAIFAWGVIDGVMYALISLFERGARYRLLSNIQSAVSDQEAVDVIADDLDYILEPITDENERRMLYGSMLVHLRMASGRLRVEREDGALLGWGDTLRRLGWALVSLRPLGLGFLWILFDPERRAWHDRLSRTRVVVLPKGSP